MNIAAKVAADKQQHPDDFCPVKGCLWRVYTSRGVNPCRKHSLGDSRTQRQEPLGSSPNGSERVAPAVSHETVGQTIALRAETEGLGSTVALCSPDGLAPSRLHGSYCKCRRCDLAF